MNQQLKLCSLQTVLTDQLISDIEKIFIKFVQIDVVATNEVFIKMPIRDLKKFIIIPICSRNGA